MREPSVRTCLWSAGEYTPPYSPPYSPHKLQLGRSQSNTSFPTWLFQTPCYNWGLIKSCVLGGPTDMYVSHGRRKYLTTSQAPGNYLSQWWMSTASPGSHWTAEVTWSLWQALAGCQATRGNASDLIAAATRFWVCGDATRFQFMSEWWICGQTWRHLELT